ncbi:transposable element Tcb2 transposase [Trichonephila clavipes]|nr:transposable element Tcb2 transposase [Trichonephila clavipes]
MDWLAYSPDLNPITLVRDMLGRRIAARQPPTTCLPELRRALLDEWCNIPQDQIDNLILSMPMRSRNNRDDTASQLSRALYAASGIRVSRVTVSRDRAACKKIYYLRPSYFFKQESRFNMVQEYKDWSMDQWVTILFNDNFRFSLINDSLGTFLWREPRTCYLLSNIREIDHYGRGGLMVWTGIKLDGRAHVHIFERGTVTAVRYRDEVL